VSSTNTGPFTLAYIAEKSIKTIKQRKTTKNHTRPSIFEKTITRYLKGSHSSLLFRDIFRLSLQLGHFI